MARLGYSVEKQIRANRFRVIEDYYKLRQYDKVEALLKAFLNDFPDDDIAWQYQAKLYMQQGRFEDALLVFDSTQLNVMGRVDKVKCYIELGEYEKSYSLANELNYYVTNPRTRLFLQRAMVYSLSMLKRSNEINILNLDYIERQMISYDRKKAIRYSKSQQNDNHLFKREISIDNVFDELEQRLDSNNKLYNSMTLTDTYLFNIEGIGNSSGRDLDIIKVITIHNREDIISAYPATKTKNYPKENIQDANNAKSKILRR